MKNPKGESKEKTLVGEEGRMLVCNTKGESKEKTLVGEKEECMYVCVCVCRERERERERESPKGHIEEVRDMHPGMEGGLQKVGDSSHDVCDVCSS